MSDAYFPFRRLLWGPIAVRLGSPAAAMDWIETSSSHIFKFDVPGFGREHVKVQVEEGNVLYVSGSKEEEKNQKEVLWHIAERHKRNEFSRRLELPENVKVEQVKAAVENGVLTVVVPKEVGSAKSKPRNIAISSKL